MADKEKVMWSLARCSCGVPDACSDCHYNSYPPRICVQHLTSDSRALLKAQEPHIMTLEEVKNRKEPMFLETKSFSDWCLFRHSDDDGLWFSVAMRDGSKIHYFGKLYGKSYRLWTSRPDEKRRAETPWE